MVAATTPLYLHKLEIEGFLRIHHCLIEANGNHVFISGPNGAGKTTILDAIWAAILGVSSRQFPEPIHHGDDKALIRLDLGEFIIRRSITSKSTSLVLQRPDGSKITTKPQAVCDSLVNAIFFDLMRFLRAAPQEQLDEVLRIAGVEPPVGEVMTITGESHPPRPGESASAYLDRLSADETGLYYVARRQANKELVQKRAAHEEQRQALEVIGGPLAPDEEEPSAADVLQQIEQVQVKADERRARLQESVEARQKHQDTVRQLTGVESERHREAEACDNLARQIEALQRQLAERRDNEKKLDERIARGRVWVAEDDAAAKLAEEVAARLPDPAPQMTALREQVKTVEQRRAQAARRRLMGEQLERLAAEAERAQAEHGRLDGILEAIRQMKSHLLDEVDFGISGLEVGDGELRLNGVPFRQASQAEQITAACAIAFKGNPDLRLLRIDDGEHFDLEHRQLLLRLANERGWQLVMTCVADTKELEIKVIDREAA